MINKIRRKRTHPFVVIDKRPLEDSRLSWKAKGLLAYLLSKPDDWVVVTNQLTSASTDGAEAIRTGLKELEKFGYATLEHVRTKGGHLGGSVWTISELATEMAVSPISAEMAVSRDSVNRPLLSNDSKVLKALKPLKRTAVTAVSGEENAVFNLLEYFTREEISAYGANWRLRYRESPDKFRRVVADLHAAKQEGASIKSYAAIANVRWNEFAPRTKR